MTFCAPAGPDEVRVLQVQELWRDFPEAATVVGARSDLADRACSLVGEVLSPDELAELDRLIAWRFPPPDG